MLEQATGARIIGDARRLPLRDECVDLVICGMMLAYAPEAFSELVRVVRRGGTLFVTDLHPKAIARGWQRTFRVGAEVLQPAHSSYSIAELAHPSLQRLGLIEAAFGEPEAAVFERAGKQSEFASMAAGPAIFVGHWSKL
jgi:ubiquinone/menaquinone biosynthesis C-methylase UbiE